MTADLLMDAIGMMDNRYIVESAVPKRKRLRVRKAIALVAAVMVCVCLSVPALAAATEWDPVYQVLYALSPTLAQKLKPVRMTCEDNGIQMEVVSAMVEGNEANIVISMRDLEEDRVDATMDLYDSYRIHTPFDSTGSCQRLGYDAATGTATFLIHISQWEEESVVGDKITFSVREFLSHKTRYEAPLDMDLQAIPTAAQTQERQEHSVVDKQDVFTSVPCLVPDSTQTDFTEGVDFTGYGYIDNQLHLQVAIRDRLQNDNHGSFYLLDASGEKRYCDRHVDWSEKEAETTVSYTEYIFDVPPDELSAYQLFAEFVTSAGSTKGNWQVTFPLENGE